MIRFNISMLLHQQNFQMFIIFCQFPIVEFYNFNDSLFYVYNQEGCTQIFCEAIYLDLVDLNINDDDLVPLKTLHFVVYF